ncbi:MAG: hypothetical protein QM811_20820 [Pirellulales bacterium]
MQKDYLLYHRGRAAHLAKDYDDAITTFLTVEKDYSTSPWARRARLSCAVSLARKGDFQAAEQLYKREAETLLSLDRKQEIADIYLEFADAFFQPKDEIAHKPDYAKALDFYTQALAVGVKPEAAARIELRIARARQLLGKHDEAIRDYQAYLKKYALGKEPTAAEKSRDIEARYRLGETEFAASKPIEARRTWQDLLAAHADVKDNLIAHAAFDLASTWNIPNPAQRRRTLIGRRRARKIHQTLSRRRTDAESRLKNRAKLLEYGLCRRRDSDAQKVLGRPQIRRTRRSGRCSTSAGERVSLAEEIRRSDRRLARLLGQAPRPRRVERSSTWHYRRRISPRRGRPTEQKLRTRPQTVQRVLG